MDDDPLFLNRYVKDIFRSQGLPAAIEYINSASITPVCRKNQLVARLLLESNRADDALLEFDRALRSNEADKSSFWEERQLVYIYEKADCLISIGLLDQALSEINYAISLPLGQAGNLDDSFSIQKAYIYYRKGLFDEALKELDRYEFGYLVAGKIILSWQELRNLILDGAAASG